MDDTLSGVLNAIAEKAKTLGADLARVDPQMQASDTWIALDELAESAGVDAIRFSPDDDQ